MFCIENREQMPALHEEDRRGPEEDIAINNSWEAKRIIVDNGRVKGVEFQKCLSVYDTDGKFKPV